MNLDVFGTSLFFLDVHDEFEEFLEMDDEFEHVEFIQQFGTF